MHEFVPTYETLYDNEKLGLRHTSRSVYVGLCIKARKDRGDRVRLPLGDDLVTGVWRLVGGKVEEVVDALGENVGGLRWPEDPAIRVEGEPGHLTVVVLAQRSWRLSGDRSESSGVVSEPTDPKTRRRLADAERKRNARRAAKATDTTADIHADTDVPRDASAPTADIHADMGADASAKRPQTECGQNADVGGVRGGVSGVQTRKREEEKNPEEKREERARAPLSRCGHAADTHADTSADIPADASADEERRLPEPRISREELGAILREVPTLVEIADSPSDLNEVYSGFRMSTGDAACVDLARRAIGALVSKERLGEMDTRKKRERVGTYLSKARQFDRDTPRSDRGSSPGGAPTSEGVRRVLDIFGEMWAKAKRAPFAASDGDEEHAAKLVELARRHVTRPNEGTAIVRHWVEKYLADRESFVADKSHPLRLLPSRVTDYGLPPAKRTPPPPAAPTPPPPSAEENAALAAAARASLGLVGKGPSEPIARPS